MNHRNFADHVARHEERVQAHLLDRRLRRELPHPGLRHVLATLLRLLADRVERGGVPVSNPARPA